MSESAPGGAAGVDACQCSAADELGVPRRRLESGHTQGPAREAVFSLPDAFVALGAGAWNLLVGVDHALKHGFCVVSEWVRVGAVPSTLGNLEP